jgi:hypothetical protein
MKSKACELSLQDDDVYVQQYHSEHERQDKKAEEEYLLKTKRQKLAKSIRQILITRVRAINSNRSRKLCVSHANKRLVNGTHLRAMFDEINPRIARMIINKNNIIFVTTLCSKRCRTHTSE